MFISCCFVLFSVLSCSERSCMSPSKIFKKSSLASHDDSWYYVIEFFSKNSITSFYLLESFLTKFSDDTWDPRPISVWVNNSQNLQNAPLSFSEYSSQGNRCSHRIWKVLFLYEICGIVMAPKVFSVTFLYFSILVANINDRLPNEIANIIFCIIVWR